MQNVRMKNRLQIVHINVESTLCDSRNLFVYNELSIKFESSGHDPIDCIQACDYYFARVSPNLTVINQSVINIF